MTSTISSDRLSIERATVEIRAVRVSGKAMTIALYEQVPDVTLWVNMLAEPEVKVLGYVLRCRKGCFRNCRRLHLLVDYCGELCFANVLTQEQGYIESPWDKALTEWAVVEQVYIAA